MKKRRINIITLGCSKNVVDSEKLMKQISSEGYEIIYNQEEIFTDTVIINTCGFINDAREESIDTILRFVKAKEQGYISNLYVMGCLSERYRNELTGEIPEVDHYFGVNDMESIIRELGINAEKPHHSERILTSPGHYAYLKISEGCDRTCAFCAIPLIRGRSRSRTIEDIVHEAGLLARDGVKEIILIAQDLTYYGIDLYKERKLPALLKELLKINGFEWIRLQYLYPAGFPGELVSIIHDNPRICSYFDIPVQHITDNMLGLMKRSHNREQTEYVLNLIRKEIPGAAIRTTLIAGHPGEREKDFRELLRFISSFRFDRLGVFAYSHEEETFAGRNFKDEIPEHEKIRRVDEIMKIQQEISYGLNQSRIGKVLKIIIDRREGDYYIGRTEYDSPDVDHEVLVSAQHQIKNGEFYQVEITAAEEFDLYGIPVETPSAD